MIFSILPRVSRRAEQASLLVAGLATGWMLFVVALNVAARMLFDITGRTVNLMIPGAIEQASYSLLILAIAAFAASMRDGMISVEIFVQSMPALVQKIAARLWYLLAMVLALVLAWSFGEEALVLFSRGDVTQDLGLPLWLFYGAIAVECLALAIVCLELGLTAEHQSEGTLS